jgi:light-regulated signal transduction histidine kinase (bacteriophytochrome)
MNKRLIFFGYLAGGIAIMIIASFWQKYILGGFEMALRPVGFIVPVLIGTLIGFIAYSLNRETKNKYNIEKRARQEVERHLNRIKSLNEDIRTFDYSVSNALRTPVRQLKGYNDLLGEACNLGETANVKDYHNRINDLLKRLNRLLDALQNYSRVSSDEMNFSKVDLGAVFNSRALNLLEDREVRNSNLDIKHGIFCHGDFIMLKTLADILIDNSIRYANEAEQLVLEFSTTEKDGKHCFYLKDNGSGINNELIKDLFTPFYAFHTARTFNDIGMGLPIAQKIVRRHHGDIWVESEEGVGTTVYFTLETTGEN